MAARKFAPIIILAPLAAGGCVAAKDVAFSVPKRDVKPYMRRGDAKIEGQGFLRKDNGDVVVCAGEDVVLMPAYGPVAEAYHLRKEGISPNVIEGDNDGIETVGFDDPDLNSTLRKTVCDAQGNFELAELPAGKWLLSTSVEWQDDNLIDRGGPLWAEVETQPEGEQRILLTSANRI